MKRKRYVSDKEAESHFRGLAKRLVDAGFMTDEEIQTIVKTSKGLDWQSALDLLIPHGNAFLATRGDRSRREETEWTVRPARTKRRGN